MPLLFRAPSRFFRLRGVTTPFRAIVLVAVLGAGLVWALWTATALQNQARADTQAELTQAARVRIELLRSQIMRSMESLHAITALLATDPTTSRAEFRRFVMPALARQPELQALEWIPLVPANQREAYEQAASADGLEGFRITELTPEGKLIPAADRAEYFPVFYLEPLRGNAPALGLDLAHHPERRLALEAARRTGGLVATATLQLAQGSGSRTGFLVFAPVKDPNSHGELLGFGLAVFRVDRLVEAAINPLVARDLRVEIHDTAQPTGPIYAAGTHSEKNPGRETWTHTEMLSFAGRDWRVVISPAANAITPPAGALAWIAPLGILTVASLLAGHLLTGYSRNTEIERQVTEKTAQLSLEVSERQRAENAARDAERRYRSIFENAINGIFQSTPDGRYLDANPALARLYGYATPAELLSDYSDIGRQLYVDPARRGQFIRAIEQHGAVADFVSQVRRRDGSIIWISEKALAVRSDTGAIRYFEGIVEDVTERIRAAENLQRANEILEQRVAERTAQLAAANNAKSVFLADMSHELRTPLNAILGYTQLLQLDSTLCGTHGPALRSIEEGGQHLLCLVNSVLDLTKIEAGRMEVAPVDFDLNVLLRGLEAMFAHRARHKSLTLRVERPSVAPVWVRGDEGKLRQILINLLDNAVKFTAAGEVRLRVVPAAADQIRFEVIDTGVGIAPEAQAVIFEPFHQEKPGRVEGGTGLGLSISRRLATLLGGDLKLKSQPRWGSNFFFTLTLPPIRPLAAAGLLDPSVALQLAPGRIITALVGDDNSASRDLLSRLLAHFGCFCFEADDLATLESLLLSSNSPDIVLIDPRLLDTVPSGWLADLREKHPELPTRFVSYSASVFASDRSRCFAMGFDAFLPKPVLLGDLRAALTQLLPGAFVTPVTTDSPIPPPHPLPTLALAPAQLCALRAAAEIGDCATLRDLLAALPAETPTPWRDHLNSLIERFDTDTITALLTTVKSEESTT